MVKYAGPDEIAGVAGTAVPGGDRFAVRRMARLLEVSASGYYAYVKRCAATALTPRGQRRADLEMKIVQAHKDSDGTYGSPRITAELRDRGEVVSAKTVARVMAGIGIEGISPPHVQGEDDDHRSGGVVPAGSGRPRVRPGPSGRRVADRHHLPVLW